MVEHQLPKLPQGSRWWIALVTFVNAGDFLSLFDPEHQGAVGWMSIIARDENALAENLRACLGEAGYQVVEIDEISIVRSFEEINEIDDHLAKNTMQLEPGKNVVWGTIHKYIADGEA